MASHEVVRAKDLNLAHYLNVQREVTWLEEQGVTFGDATEPMSLLAFKRFSERAQRSDIVLNCAFTVDFRGSSSERIVIKSMYACLQATKSAFKSSSSESHLPIESLSFDFKA